MFRPLLLSFVVVLAIPASAAEQTIAYSKGATIYTVPLDGKKAQKLVRGAWPDISPDGTRVAYNTEDEKTTERHIAIADVATGKTTILKDIPGNNAYGPVWSPDGRQLVFNILDGSEWNLGLVNADGTGFRPIRKNADSALYAPAWAADGKSLFCHDLEALYRIDLHGKVLEQWKLSDLFGDRAGMNSGCKLAPSSDGRTLLMDVDANEDIERPDWDGPPPAIWQLDLATGKATEVTKASLFAWNPALINDREILCRHTPKGAREIAIYRLALKGGQPRLVIPDGDYATISK